MYVCTLKAKHYTLYINHVNNHVYIKCVYNRVYINLNVGSLRAALFRLIYLPEADLAWIGSLCVRPTHLI